MKKKEGRNVVMLLPSKTIEVLDELSLNLQVSKNSIVNTLIYANPDFKSGPFTEATVIRDRKKAHTCIRLSPYTDAIATEAAKRQDTFAGSWIKKLLITKCNDVMVGGQNAFNNNRHPELPEAIKRKRDQDNSRCGDEGQRGGSAPTPPKKQLGDWLRDCSR